MSNLVFSSADLSRKLTGSPGYDWTRSSSLSPTDTKSPVYPDRPIRPLPKRNLRSRLSADKAKTITYPPVLSTSSPLFDSPPPSDRFLHHAYYQGGSHLAVYDSSPNRDLSARLDGCESSLDSDEELDNDTDLRQRYPSPGRKKQNVLRQGAVHSATSSVDGYDSFENNNNKKKRKIPDHQRSLPPNVAELEDAEIHAATEKLDRFRTSELPGPDSSSGSGVGLSGPGRGRHGKTAKASREKQPLGVSMTSSNTAPRPTQAGTFAFNSNHTKQSPTVFASSLAASSGNNGLTREREAGQPSKIISDAINNAKGMKQNLPNKGQENVSILQNLSAPSNHAQSAHQFDFSVPSTTSDRLYNSNQNASRASHAAAGARGMSTQGTQTSPGTIPGPPGGTPQTTAGSHQPQPAPPPADQPPPHRQPSPRSIAREYKRAARERQYKQRLENFHHPPSREDVWICEFCEYESIFGYPPRALIRQYEVKDLRKRQEADNRKRLLEKAKAKSRKNKKGSKGQSGKNNVNDPAPDDPTQPQRYDQYDNVPPQDEDGGDEFYDETYDGEPLPGEEYADEFDDDGYTPGPASAGVGVPAPSVTHSYGHGASRSV